MSKYFSIGRRALVMALIVSLHLWHAGAANAQVTSIAEQQTIKNLETAVLLAGEEYKAKKFDQSAKHIEHAMRQLSELDNASAATLESIRGDYGRIAKAHQLLTQAGQQLSPLPQMPRGTARDPGQEVPPNPSTTGQASRTKANGLEYQWEEGKEYNYEFKVEAEIDGQRKTHQGTINYKVTGEALSGFQEQDSTGTAFVVSNDGYLVTCAHVVGDADQVMVSVKGKEYQAKVIEKDELNDIALLKTNATGLQPLPLGSKKVKQGQKVRVLGFPMASLLGKQAKLTEGAVAGFLDKSASGNEDIQIDATVNPGNSGGPLLDDYGNVLGVVKAKLIGLAISNVGFVEPAQQVRKMLDRHRVRTIRASEEAISTANLTEQSQRSVCLVTASGNQATKHFNLRWNSTLDGKSNSGKMTVTNKGATTNETGRADQKLPYMLGNVSSLCIEELSRQNTPQWETMQVFEMLVPKQERHAFDEQLMLRRSRSPIYSYRNRYGSRLGRGSSYASVETYRALETSSFMVTSTATNSIKIDKHFEFQTLKDADNPLLRIKGLGRFEFDTTIGMPKSYTYNATVALMKDGSAVKAPIKVTYRMRDAAEVEAEKIEKQERLAESRRKAKDRATVPNPQLVRETLDKIASKRGSARGYGYSFQPLTTIAVVDELLPEVLQSAADCLKNETSYGSRIVFDAVEHWCGSDKKKLLKFYVENYNSKATPNHGDFFKALNQFDVADEHRSQVLEIAKSCLSETTDRSARTEVTKTLKKWGGDDTTTLIIDGLILRAERLENDHSLESDVENFLKTKPTEAGRARAVKLAESLLSKSYEYDHQAGPMHLHAITIFSRWALESDRAKLLAKHMPRAKLERMRGEQKKVVYTALAEAGTDECIKVLLGRFRVDADHEKHVVNALILCGEPCEDVVIETCKNSEKNLLRSLRFFENKGTEKCISMLERRELDCHKQYDRDKIHKSRVQLLQRLGK